MTRQNYDGRRFTPVGSPEDDRPVALWRQDGATVTARFSGGPVLAGFLLGTVGADGVVHAAYGQLLRGGADAGAGAGELTVQAGRCTTTPDLLPDGRLRMREEWHRTDGSSGVSYLEEVLP
jgi:hypothetical protein